MNITLTPELEAAITEQARPQEISPERLALDALRSLFVTSAPTPEEILRLAAQVYVGLSAQDVLEVEKIVLNRNRKWRGYNQKHGR